MVKFVMKWLINGVIVVSFMMFYSYATFWSTVIAATGLTVVAYLIGDQLVLRKAKEPVATITDFILTVAYFGILSYVFDWGLTWGETIFLALLIGAAEWLLHKFVFQDDLTVS